MQHARFDEKKAQRVLKKLIRVNLIRRVGKGPATRYEDLSGGQDRRIRMESAHGADVCTARRG